MIVTGRGDHDGYHLWVGRERERYAMRPLASIQPNGFADDTWLGYQCVTGDGRHVVVTVAPRMAVNKPELRFSLPSHRDHESPMSRTPRSANCAVYPISKPCSIPSSRARCSVAPDGSVGSSTVPPLRKPIVSPWAPDTYCRLARTSGLPPAGTAPDAAGSQPV
ncbi:hypothetical protein [Micromonospora sp. NPDC005413]|uniref:hypothetical protein n=1 Tax=Micromonospora sp. NPDC005413 TaxID=3154563 RepID=UPI0033ABE9DA